MVVADVFTGLGKAASGDTTGALALFEPFRQRVLAEQDPAFC